MDLTERQVETQTVYDGVIVRVRLDQASLPNGRTARREVVEHPGGVTILPVDESGVVTLVRQYRYPLGQLVLEAPAGKLERGEDPLEGGVRELSEEVGLTAGRLTYLGAMYPSPGFCDEVLHMYLAQELTQGDCHPDEDEFLELVRMPLEEAVERVMNNEIADGKTVCVLMKAWRLLGRR